MYTSTSESFTVSNVPAFLTKLWALVESPVTDELICWDESGQSFHVRDQARFAKEILPLYFKHNNIASFIRQLNMYGFRKVVNTDAVNMKLDKDDMEFTHQFFVKGQEQLLDFIKRKVPTSKGVGGAGGGGLDESLKGDDVNTVLTEVNSVKNKQDTMTVKLENLKLENEVLWREVATLRQMHMKQQQIVNKLIQFLVSMVGNNRTLSGGLKRKGPLMLGAASSPSPAKIPRDQSTEKLYHVQSPQPSPTSVGCEQKPSTGMLIDDVTDLLSITTDPVTSSEPAAPDIFATSSATLSDSLEPLAVFESRYAPTLQLSDVLDEDADIPVVALDDVLPTASVADNNATMSSTSTAANPLLTTTALAVSEPRSSRNDLSTHIDSTFSQLTGLRDLLASSPQINIDPSMMFELFGLLDSNIPTSLCTNEDGETDMWRRGADLSSAQLRSESNGSIVGNELVQYSVPDDFSSLYDASDLGSYPGLFDNDSLSTDAVDDDVLLSLATPRPQTSVAGRHIKTESTTDVMEDID